MKGTTMLLALVVLLPLAPVVPGWTEGPAPAAGSYDLSWWTVDGGGVTFYTEAGYSLGATAGQPDTAQWAGGSYNLAGGFWPGLTRFRIYLPLVLRGP
jgi:hypothetical protein